MYSAAAVVGTLAPPAIPHESKTGARPGARHGLYLNTSLTEPARDCMCPLGLGGGACGFLVILTWNGAAICRAIFGQESGLNGLARTMVEVSNARTVSIAVRAADGTPLRKPESALSTVAHTGSIGAWSAFWINHASVWVFAVGPWFKGRVNGVAGRRHYQ